MDVGAVGQAGLLNECDLAPTVTTLTSASPQIAGAKCGMGSQAPGTECNDLAR